MEAITAASLRAWRRRHGMTQEALGSQIGLTKVAITKMEGGQRQIRPPEQKLLQLLVYGHSPFSTPELDAKSAQLDFSVQEWEIIHLVAKREGYADAKQWIADKIRSYLRMNPETSVQQVAAEDQAAYNHPSRRDPSVARSKR